MKKQSSFLDIIIPVYGREASFNQLIEALLNSIKNNDLSEQVKIIIVDDASLKPIRVNQSNPPLDLLRNDSNSGAPFSRHKGYLKSKGKFVHFHDSDDNISESWLIEIVKYLKDNPKTDILLTARDDIDQKKKSYKLQKFFHKKADQPSRIKKRLIYRNCMGPLGGVTFSRQILKEIDFKSFASCQDWQMYHDALKHAKVLVSRPDIKFIFNKTGDDRISHNPRKKILGHLQLAKITGPKSPFKRSLRLFYLYTCKQHVLNKGGQVLRFYKKNRVRIFLTFFVVSVYWRLT